MEADGLRWSLIVFGSLVIVGVAIHGIWISRKNNEKKSQGRSHSSQKSEQEFQPGGWSSQDEVADEELTNNAFADDPEIKFDMDEPDILGTDNTQSQPVEPNSHSAHLENEFDELGLGTVRVVSATSNQEPASATSNQSTMAEEAVNQEQQEQSKASSSSKIYASVVTQPKPEYAQQYQSLAAETVAISQQEKTQPSTVAYAASGQNTTQHTSTQQTASFSNSQHSETNTSTINEMPSSDGFKSQNHQAPEPPASLLKKQPVVDDTSSKTTEISQPETQVEDNEHTTLAEKLSLTEQARNLVKRKKAGAGKKRREPKIAEDQMRIDFDDEPIEAAPPKEKPAKEASPEQQQEVLVLNVKMPDGENIAGSALLPMLLTLGFKFGDQDIFHRHVNSNGKGPVLFSLANMFKPGNFDIDNLENFTTQGVSLFMILPIEGDPHQVFNMMHNAARKISDEFSAQIYDARRALLTKQSLQQYVEKIREFERQRMLAR